MIDLMDRLRSRPVIAVLRAPDAHLFADAARVLYDAGITCIEFTLTTVGALDAVTAARKALPNDVIMGVGTLRCESDIRRAIDAGAEFVVSQLFDPVVATTARKLDISLIPGALTPNEIVSAWNAGVHAVKVSPIGPIGGPEYLTQLRGPLPEIPLVPSGGVELHTAVEYLRRGATAVGVSGALTGDALVNRSGLSGLSDRAKQLCSAVDELMEGR